MKHAATALLILFLAGCQSSISQPTQAPIPPSQPTPLQTFTDSNAGISFQYPASWKNAGRTNTQFKVTAVDDSQFTLDVPVLPFHIPGMIPVDQVESGYIDDFKKRMPDAASTPLPDPTLPDAKQRRVKLTGHLGGGKPSTDEAALIVHNDHVYILAIDADEKSYAQMHTSLDAILASLHWTH